VRPGAALGWAGLLGSLVACGVGARGPGFETSETFPETPRRPPSFAPEPSSLEADAISDANAREARDAAFAIVRAPLPLDPETAREVVSRFFMAVLSESTRELFPLFGTQAVVLSEGNRQPAQAVWRARFAQLDYTSLSGRIVAAPQTLRTYTFATAARAKLDGVPAPSSEAEVVVLARPASSWTGKTRLFGDAMAFRLRPRPAERGYEIAEIVEDFRLP
jgi:hypothetical protein